MAKKEKENTGVSRARSIRGFSPDAKMYFGENEEGLKFGPKNNPRREGSKVAENFAKLKDGMTLRKVRELGISSGTIGKALDRGWIVIEEAEGVDGEQEAA